MIGSAAAAAVGACGDVEADDSDDVLFMIGIGSESNGLKESCGLEVDVAKQSGNIDEAVLRSIRCFMCGVLCEE